MFYFSKLSQLPKLLKITVVQYLFVYILHDLAMLRSVNTMLPVTLEKPTMFLYITITFFHTPLRLGRAME